MLYYLVVCYSSASKLIRFSINLERVISVVFKIFLWSNFYYWRQQCVW